MLFCRPAALVAALLGAVANNPTDAFLAAAPRPIIRSRQHNVLMAAATPPPPPPPAVTTVASSASSASTAPTMTASNLPSQKELLAKSSSSSTSTTSSSAAAAAAAAPTSSSLAASSNKGTSPGIIISSINYDGQVPKTESDEYVVITNNSKSPIDISGYYVYVATTGTQGPTFTFPKSNNNNNNGVVLKAGESVRIYTNEIHKESGGYSFGSGKAIWSNNGGLAVLKDGAGKKIGEFKY